ACLFHLLQSAADGLDLLGEGLLQADVRALRADRVRRDREALEHLVWIRAQQRPVLERGRLTLRGVAHGEAGAGSRRADRPPLLACRESGAAAAAQTALRDFVDDRVR